MVLYKKLKGENLQFFIPSLIWISKSFFQILIYLFLKIYFLGQASFQAIFEKIFLGQTILNFCFLVWKKFRKNIANFAMKTRIKYIAQNSLFYQNCHVSFLTSKWFIDSTSSNRFLQDFVFLSSKILKSLLSFDLLNQVILMVLLQNLWIKSLKLQ